MAVKQGDELNTEKGRVEVNLGKGNWVRLDQHTRVVFTDFQSELMTLSLWQGSLYLQLNNQMVKVRSPQDEHSFQEEGLYRVDVKKNKTEVYENPRVVDRFDSWSQRREERAVRREYEPNYGEAYPYDGWTGWTFSPLWPWSAFDWYMGWYPIWNYYNPYLWSFHYWPTWYFGWNPFWYWNTWYYGYYPYGYGYGYGYGHYYDYNTRSYRRYGQTVIRKDQLRPLRGIIRKTDRAVQSAPLTLNSPRKIYPSRITSGIRRPSYSSGSRVYSRFSGSFSSRFTTSRSFSNPSYRSFSGRSFSRSSGSSHSGGIRRK